MELKIDKASLLQGLYLAQGISDRKSTMPILANVLLRTDGKDKLLIAATDLNVTLTAEIPCKVEKEGGLTVGAKHLHEIVKSLPSDELVIRRAENNYAEIKAGKVAYKLVGMADRDFPKLPNHREVGFSTVDAGTLRDMIAKTFFSISTDETRYHLHGVLFEADGVLARMVSTDGHRLSKIERPLGSVAAKPDKGDKADKGDKPDAAATEGLKLAAGVIIPRKGLAEVRRMLEHVDGACEMGVHQGHVFLRSKAVALSVKLIDAQFPPYEQVIPKENEKIAIAPRLGLVEALRRISLVSSDKTWGIKLTLGKGSLQVASDNPDLGEAREELEVSYDGAALAIGFNAKYFIELLGEMDGDEVQLEFNGELDPGLVRSADKTHGGYLGVVMPMRI